MECIHRKGVHSQGNHETVYRCNVFGHCTINDGGLKKNGVPIAVCSKPCEKLVSPPTVGVRIKSNRPKANFAYVTGSDRVNEPAMMARMIQSAREVGVKEDFHAFAVADVPDSTTHREPFKFDRYMFKVELLKRMADSAYDFLVWVDPDHYFVRDPGDWSEQIRDNPIWVSMEGDLMKRNPQWVWWGVLPSMWKQIYEEFGANGPEKWNTNAGLFIVRTSAVSEFAEKMYAVKNRCNQLGLKEVTEEPPLAIVGQTMVPDYHLNMFSRHKHVWVSDWIKTSTKNGTRIPDGTPFEYRDWATDTPLGKVNPALIHLLGGKTVLGGTIARPAPISREPVGTKLHEILAECGIQRPSCGDCKMWMQQMDHWGIDGCRQHRREIVQRLNHASKGAGWLAMAKVAAKGYLSIEQLLDEAMKRAQTAA